MVKRRDVALLICQSPKGTYVFQRGNRKLEVLFLRMRSVFILGDFNSSPTEQLARVSSLQRVQLSWLCSPWVMHLGPALHPPCTVSGYPIRILINSVIVCRAVVTGSKGSRRWEALGAQHRSHQWVKETRARVEQRARGRV